ncbi:hypothetical protein N7454_010420 [Penicillium verhagenii]|nr:hypothetical protein N7454_010420 [Penicillium verhagenii]
MASIKDLLNPLPEDPVPKTSQSAEPSQNNKWLPLPQPSRNSQPRLPALKPAREAKSKTPKDGAIFKIGKPIGEVRYPPCEDRDEALLQIHREYKLYPLGNISDFPRHIPYNSQKKDFHEKTGRDCFNVFHYTFQMPGDDYKWMVMWDYNIGLTAPGKVMNYIPGLRNICHSITGGALAAQGYWMPYEVAKSVSATFCWNIRHVLTPLFGTDFPSTCVPFVNGKARDFPHGIMIDPRAICHAGMTAREYRNLEPAQGSSSNTGNRASTPAQTPAPENVDSHDTERVPYRQIHPKMPRRSYADSVSSARDSSSEPSFCHSPLSTVPHSFTPVNPPRTLENIPRSSVPSPEGSTSHHNRRIEPVHQSSTGMIVNVGSRMDALAQEWQSRNANDTTMNTTLDTLSGDGQSSMATSPTNSDDSDSDDEDYQESASKRVSRRGKGKGVASRSLRAKNRDRAADLREDRYLSEVKAAHALVRLHMQKLARPDSDDGEVPMNESVWSPDLEQSKSKNGKKRRSSV